jgi:hypothetical protein
MPFPQRDVHIRGDARTPAVPGAGSDKAES